MNRSSVIITVGILALFLSVAACSYDSPTAPPTDTSQPGPSGATISITSSGLTPNTVAINTNQSVTFTNNDSIAHEMVSGPVPTYTDCPAINRVGRLEPGQSMVTGALTVTRSCAFLDLLQTGDSRWQGTITIQ